MTCHNTRLKTANLALDALDVSAVGDHTEDWEKVVRKLRGGLMPPAGRPRPDRADAGRARRVARERSSTRRRRRRPNPGRTETFHRLNRAEYHNAVRDVLALDLDVASLLPGDSASYGFDNMAGALKLSESLMERYLSAARKISRAAIGAAPSVPAAADLQRVARPAAGRAGRRACRSARAAARSSTHQFPQDAEYVFSFNLANTTGGAELDVLLDGERLKLFNIKRGARAVDADGNELLEKLEIRMPVTAGPHEVGVAFVKTPTVLAEANRRPFLNPTVSRHRRRVLRGVTITAVRQQGRQRHAEPPGSTRADRCRTLSRSGLVCRPAAASAESGCARTILSTLARRAYRRPVDDEDMKIADDGLRAGRARTARSRPASSAASSSCSSARSSCSASKPSRHRAKAGTAYRISDLELASRLSFFLWSSVPDDELLDLAARGQLRQPASSTSRCGACSPIRAPRR